MPAYAIDIENTERGTYTKVRKLLTSALGKDAVDYDKPVFTVEVGAADFDEVRPALAGIAGVAIVEVGATAAELEVVAEKAVVVAEKKPAAKPSPPKPEVPPALDDVTVRQIRAFAARGKRGTLQLVGCKFVINTSRGGTIWCAHLQAPKYQYLGDAATCFAATKHVEDYLIKQL